MVDGQPVGYRLYVQGVSVPERIRCFPGTGVALHPRSAVIGGDNMRAFGFYFGLWLLAWLALTGAQIGSLVVGVPVVACAAWASSRFERFPKWRVSPVAALRFAASFAWNSVLAGADIARRVTRRDMGLKPDLFDYTLRLPPGIARLLFIHSVNLQPGTVSVAVGTDHLRIWVLDARVDHVRASRQLEEQVAQVFGIALDPVTTMDGAGV